MKRKELIERVTAAGRGMYGEREAGAIARLVAEKKYGLTRADVALEPDAEVETEEELAAILEGLAAGRPVQYLLGRADFDEMELAVGEGVLIPRGETEELVRWVAQETIRAGEGTQKILDVGTGSGAIAIALARRLPGAEVEAADVSEIALEWARKNNLRAGTEVKFWRGDVTAEDFLAGRRYDIIVSNPPYIPESERAQMADNVRANEPEEALFVPDGDALVFYRAIARLGRRALEEGGRLYFEVHEKKAGEVMQLLEAEGFRGVEMRRDIHDKPRMVRCMK